METDSVAAAPSADVGVYDDDMMLDQGRDDSDQVGTTLSGGDNAGAAHVPRDVFSVRCAYGSEKATISGLQPSTTVGELRQRLAEQFGVPVEQQTNLILRGRNLTKTSNETTLAEAGLDAAFKGRLVLVGTLAEDVQRFREEEEAVVRRDAALERARERGGGGSPRARRVVNVADIDAGQFLRLEPLPREVLPPGAAGPEEALALLEKLRADRGIAALMQKYGWKVGKLSEFAPSLSTGIVGVTSGCLLGFNKNRGEEISLRLRTDDFRGFRYYGTILKTLIHELTHMRHGDHDVHFWEFNSVLTKEYQSLDWQRGEGRTVGSGGTLSAAVQEWEAASPAEMAAYAAAERVLAQQRKAADEQDTKPSSQKASPSAQRRTPPTQRASPSTRRHTPPTQSTTTPPGGQSLMPGALSQTRQQSAMDGTSTPTVPALDETASASAPTQQAAEAAEVLPSDDENTAAARIDAFCAAVRSLKEELVTADETAMGLADSLLQLAAGCDGDAASLRRSVGVLRKLVGNLREHPGDDKYRSVKIANPKVYDAIGRYPAAISFLERAGFSRTDGGALLTYGRNDPGLLWLAGGILDESAASLGV